MKRYFIVSKKITKTSLHLVQNGYTAIYTIGIDVDSKLHLFVDKKLKFFAVIDQKDVKENETVYKENLSKITLKKIEQWES